jgi:transposase
MDAARKKVSGPVTSERLAKYLRSLREPVLSPDVLADMKNARVSEEKARETLKEFGFLNSKGEIDEKYRILYDVD